MEGTNSLIPESPSLRNRRPQIDPNFCKELLMVNASTSVCSPEENKFIEFFKTQHDINFIPLSTCQRYVYLMQYNGNMKNKISKEPIYKEIFDKIQSKYSTKGLQILSGDDAIKTLIYWLAGAGNKTKHCNDTYNRKLIKNKMELLPAFIENGNNRKALIASKIEMNKKFDKQINVLMKSNNKHKDDEIGWINAQKGTLEVFANFMPFRDSDPVSRANFLDYINKNIEISDKIVTGLEAMKNHPQLIRLWSAPINKANLDILQNDNPELHSKIIALREEFVSSYADIVYTVAKYQNINHSIKECANFFPNIFDLKITDLMPQVEAFIELKQSEANKPKAEANQNLQVINQEEEKKILNIRD